MNAKNQNLAKWTGGIIAVGGVVLLVFVVSDFRSGRQPGEPPAPTPVLPESSVQQAAAPIPAQSRTSPPPTSEVQAAASLEAASLQRASARSDGVIRVSPGKVLATVNGAEITLKDLLPLPAAKAGAEQVLSAERFSFLLDRAIEREVAVQAARSAGIELTASQRRQLEQLRAQSNQTEPGVFDTVQQNPANTEFALRDAAGLMLQAALAEKAGVPSPHVTPAQVQAYYQQHQADYGALPVDQAQRAAAWERIDRDIRLKLASQVQAEHQARLREFLNELTASAQVSKSAS